MEEKENIPEKQPAENIPEEINSPEETVVPETEQPPTLNIKPLNTDMEVHHHSHPAHGKKTWKAYFWEFLMLFLAVFCGFLAEYQLEHLIEHQREKQFIKSMVDDLKDDHEKLNQYNTELQLGVRQMDTLITILGNNELIKTNGNQLYYLGRVSPRFNVFTSNNRTLEQLKNSGSFRLIRNAPASNKIMAYYNSMGFIRHLEALYFQEFEEYKRIAAKVFEPGVFRMMEEPDGEVSRNANNPALRTNDPELLKELGVYAVYLNGSRRSILPATKILQKDGDELIAYLKKEYHFD